MANPRPCLAADRAAAVRLAEKIAEQAKKALEGGEFDKAAELYLAAFNQAPGELILVYNAARAYHLGRRFDLAEPLYQRYAKAPDADPKLAERAGGYLAEIALARAAERADEAEHLFRAGHFGEAAAAWRDAYRRAPSRPGYLLKAARAARLHGDVDGAKADYAAYLALALPSLDRAEAERELALLQLPRPAALPAEVTPPAAVALPAEPTPARQAHTKPTEPAAVALAEPRPDNTVARWAWTGGAAIEAVTGSGVAGLGFAAEGWLGRRLPSGLGYGLVVRPAMQVSGVGAWQLAAGMAAKYDLGAVQVAAAAELVTAKASETYLCNPPFDPATAQWCARDVPLENVARLRLRAAYWVSPSSLLHADLVTGLGLQTLQPQAALVFGIAAGRP